MPVRPTANTARASLQADLDEDVQVAAQALTRSLSAVRQKPGPGEPGVARAKVLNALSANWGQKNGQVLKAKFQSPTRTRLAVPTQAARKAVNASADSARADDLTATGYSAVKALDETLDAMDAADEGSKARAPDAPSADVIEEIVEDVTSRVQKHRFGITAFAHAHELARESASAVGHDDVTVGCSCIENAPRPRQSHLASVERPF